MFLGFVVSLQVSLTCEVQVAKVTLQLVPFCPLEPVPFFGVRVVNDLLEGCNFTSLWRISQKIRSFDLKRNCSQTWLATSSGQQLEVQFYVTFVNKPLSTGGAVNIVYGNIVNGSIIFNIVFLKQGHHKNA